MDANRQATYHFLAYHLFGRRPFAYLILLLACYRVCLLFSLYYTSNHI
jgi:hypothetical protein